MGNEMRNLLVFFRLLMAAFLLCSGAQQALAQKVLLLTTNEVATDATQANNNLEAEFAGVVGAANLTRMTVLSNPNAISQTTFTSAPGPYDIVVVASTYLPVDPTNWTVLQSAVANRWANSIVFLWMDAVKVQMVVMLRRWSTS